MIEIKEALGRVLERAKPRTPQRLSLCHALGCVLSEDVISDIDSPPYDKAQMDGYAVIASDLRGGRGEMMVIDEVTAGDIPCEPLQSGMATRIMTGAPVPRGADTVVVDEQCHLDASGDIPTVRVDGRDVRPGQNILYRGMSMRRGETVLPSGRTLSAIDAGLLAEVGRTEVLVHPEPRVAVLATGNELVPSAEVPGPGQIRNSNGPMLCALVRSTGGQPVDLGAARDNEADLAHQINEGLQEDMLLLSGGVSTGILDLVPRVLRDLGVEQVFHGVRLKPGKPLWFGTLPHAKGPRLVFGLPGNPVSGLVCFELFVRSAIAALAAKPPQSRASVTGELQESYRQRGDRPTYYPVQLQHQADKTLVRLLDWQGSADLRTLTRADGLAVFPAERQEFGPGETVTVLRL
jgi:molybdopterin molybdotransferase